MKPSHIPDYFVYGENPRQLDVGFLHVELVSARKNEHFGEVRAHKHSQMAQITFWIKGGGTYTIEDQTWSFSAPAISYVPANVVHGFHVSPQSDAIVFSTEAKSDYPTFFVQGKKPQNDWRMLRDLMQMILAEYQNNAPSSVAPLSEAVMAIAARQGAEGVASRHELAERLQKQIDLHFRENWQVAQYVYALHSTYHLVEKSAKLAFDKTIKDLITARKILEAKRLLQFTIRSVENIAYELGYKDPAYFNREFKKSVGVAPGFWRKSKLENIK